MCPLWSRKARRRLMCWIKIEAIRRIGEGKISRRKRATSRRVRKGALPCVARQVTRIREIVLRVWASVRGVGCSRRGRVEGSRRSIAEVAPTLSRCPQYQTARPTMATTLRWLPWSWARMNSIRAKNLCSRLAANNTAAVLPAKRKISETQKTIDCLPLAPARRRRHLQSHTIKIFHSRLHNSGRTSATRRTARAMPEIARKALEGDWERKRDPKSDNIN